jgi:hypothetical protein
MGYGRAAHEGPTDYIARIKQRNPALGNMLGPVFSRYARLRYGRNQRRPAATRALRRKAHDAVRRLKKRAGGRPP